MRGQAASPRGQLCPSKVQSSRGRNGSLKGSAITTASERSQSASNVPGSGQAWDKEPTETDRSIRQSRAHCLCRTRHLWRSRSLLRRQLLQPQVRAGLPHGVPHSTQSQVRWLLSTSALLFSYSSVVSILPRVPEAGTFSKLIDNVVNIARPSEKSLYMELHP